jgi:hypothetical protein
MDQCIGIIYSFVLHLPEDVSLLKHVGEYKLTYDFWILL